MTLDPPPVAENADASPEVAAVPSTADRPVRVKSCPECGDEFSPPAKGPGQHKRFCSDKCRLAWANREKGQGAVLVTVAKAWRKTRGSGALGKATFAEMTRILDLLLERDRAEGRADRLEPYVRDLLASGVYFDRMEENRLGTDRVKRKRAAKAERG